MREENKKAKGLSPESIFKLFHEYGREDFLFRKGQQFENSVKYAGYEDMSKNAYEQGYREAEEVMQKLGATKFYLTALMERMDGSVEWYGSDFDEARQLVQWAMEAFETGIDQATKTPRE